MFGMIKGCNDVTALQNRRTHNEVVNRALHDVVHVYEGVDYVLRNR